ncbi:MAG: LacI family transcriptional regulator [Desulfobacterales bacterium]|nr:LacI family transcriptional regulator [Desulfobacterales bacterium]
MVKKKPTIKDIAQMAGVSPTTVSMVMNNRPRVSDEMRDKIMAIAGKINYRPNLLARSMVNRRSFTIGLIINDIADPFYPELAKGVEEKARELGFHVILCNTNNTHELEKIQIEMLRSRNVDGIILSTVSCNDPHIRALKDDAVPFVLINRTITTPGFSEEVDYIVLDNYSGGYKAIEHLHRLGHDRIGIITGDLNSSTAAERTRGAIKALDDFNLQQDASLTKECHYSRSSAKKAAQSLLNLENRPTAIFAQDDNMAIGAREAIIEAGYTVPEDIALIGFDDIDMASLAGIDLTTISQKKYEMGAAGMEILSQKIEKGNSAKLSRIKLKAELIIRKSCGYNLYGYKKTKIIGGHVNDER